MVWWKEPTADKPWIEQGGGGLESVNDWSDLSALEPASTGMERFVANGIPGAALSGRVLARRGASQWGIPGADAATIAYLAGHQIPAPAFASEVITLDGYTDTTYTNSAEKTYALRLIAKAGKGPIYGIRLLGRNTASNHAQIKGIVLGSGSVNNTAMSAANYIQAPFVGGTGNSITPANGSVIQATEWITQDVDFPAAIQEGESGIARITTSAGNICYPSIGIGSSRSNFADIATGWATADGDYGSTPAAAASNPSWNASVGVLPFAIIIKRDASKIGQRHAAFGDSIIEGFGNSTPKDRWLYTAMSGLSGNRRITSFGRGGLTVQQYCQLFEYWLDNSPIASLFSSCSVSGWSWNNVGDQTSAINAAVASAVAKGISKGKRMSVWFPTPAGLQSGGSGNIASRANCYAYCVSQGYNVVDTSATITDVNGYSIIGTYTGDGVHLNQAGQDVMGSGIAAAQSVIFG